MKSSRRPTIRRRGVVIVPLAAVRASCEGHGDYAKGGEWKKEEKEDQKEGGRRNTGREEEVYEGKRVRNEKGKRGRTVND